MTYISPEILDAIGELRAQIDRVDRLQSEAAPASRLAVKTALCHLQFAIDLLDELDLAQANATISADCRV